MVIWDFFIKLFTEETELEIYEGEKAVFKGKREFLKDTDSFLKENIDVSSVGAKKCSRSGVLYPVVIIKAYKEV